MELRRALVLFGIVLGIAALVSIIAQPPDRSDNDATERAEPTPPPATTPAATPSAPSAGPTPAPEGTPFVRMTPKDSKAAIDAGEAVTLVVAVDKPGVVGLEGLGLDDTAEPNTPAQFELLVSSPGKHRVVLVPAAGGEARQIGTLEIRAAS